MTESRHGAARPGSPVIRHPSSVIASAASREATAERLQNLLAQRGIASRRGAAELIRAGRVTVEGAVVTEPGARVSPTATLALDGRPIRAQAEPHRTFLYYKPVGEVCSTEGQGAPTALERFRAFGLRLVCVGRLDKESEGLLLISNDGDLVQRLTHPRFAHRKVYEVTVTPAPTPEHLRRLRAPMVLEGYRIRPVRVDPLSPDTLRFTLTEGRHRQIRLMCEQAHLRVRRLKRVALASLTLGALRPGTYRELTPAELAALGDGDGSRQGRGGAGRGDSSAPTPSGARCASPRRKRPAGTRA